MTKTNKQNHQVYNIPWTNYQNVYIGQTNKNYLLTRIGQKDIQQHNPKTLLGKYTLQNLIFFNFKNTQTLEKNTY